MKTKQKITEIVAEQLCIDTDDIQPGVELAELGADSLDHVGIIWAVEEEFDVEIPDGTAPKLTTVDSIVEYIDNLGKA